MFGNLRMPQFLRPRTSASDEVRPIRAGVTSPISAQVGARGQTFVDGDELSSWRCTSPGAAKSRFIRSTCRGVKPAKIKRQNVPLPPVATSPRARRRHPWVNNPHQPCDASWQPEVDIRSHGEEIKVATNEGRKTGRRRGCCRGPLRPMRPTFISVRCRYYYSYMGVHS